jgi:hypothetical protein
MSNAWNDWHWGKAETYPLWESKEYLGVSFHMGQNELTSEKQVWLRDRGWIAQVFEGRIVVAPLVFVTSQSTYYHTTPVENLDGIFENDLLTGHAAGRSTSDRRDCTGHIYVSLTLESARQWAGDQLLGNTNVGQEWGIIQIDADALKGRVFRDPASTTGYMLEDNRVAKRFLREVERFRSAR